MHVCVRKGGAEWVYGDTCVELDRPNLQKRDAALSSSPGPRLARAFVL